MVEPTAPAEYLTCDLVALEVRRWLAMHEVAGTVFDGLPPDQQDTIRRDGQPITTPLAMLVGSKPEVRELAATILRDVLAFYEGSLSYPLATVGAKTDTEDAGVGRVEELQAEVDQLEEKMARIEGLLRELVDLVGGSRSGTPQPG